MSKVQRMIGCFLIFAGIMVLFFTSGYGEVEMVKTYDSAICVVWIVSVVCILVGAVILNPYQFFKHLSAIMSVAGVILYMVFRIRRCRLLYVEYRIIGSFSKFYETQLLAWDLIHESE